MKSDKIILSNFFNVRSLERRQKFFVSELKSLSLQPEERLDVRQSWSIIAKEKEEKARESGEDKSSHHFCLLLSVSKYRSGRPARTRLDKSLISLVEETAFDLSMELVYCRIKWFEINFNLYLKEYCHEILR